MGLLANEDDYERIEIVALHDCVRFIENIIGNILEALL